MPEFPAITHVALTVTSLERSVPWYKALFGSDPILDEDTGPFQRVAWLAGGTVVGLTQFHDLNSTEPFNERRQGLDHLAFEGARTRLETHLSAAQRRGEIPATDVRSTATFLLHGLHGLLAGALGDAKRSKKRFIEVAEELSTRLLTGQ